MTNGAVRDTDIVAPQFVPTTKKILVNEDGTATDIKFVDFDAAGGGYGSEDSPFHSFTDFNAKFVANDVIYVLPKNSNIEANRDATSVQLLGGQELISSKEGVMVSDFTGNETDNFVIKKDASTEYVKLKTLTVTNNNLVQGFEFRNRDAVSNHGVVILDKGRNIIKNNFLNDNLNDGINANVNVADTLGNIITGNIASDNDR